MTNNEQSTKFLKFKAPLSNKEIDFSEIVDEDFYFQHQSILHFKCKKFIQNFSKNPTPNNEKAITYCYMYHHSPLIRKCMPRRFMHAFDASEETLETITQCIESDEQKISLFSKIESKISEITPKVFQKYSKHLEKQAKRGNLELPKLVKNEMFIHNANRLSNCLINSAKYLNLELPEMASFVVNEETDYCFPELKQYIYSVAIHYCAIEFHDCLKREEGKDLQTRFNNCLSSNIIQNCLRTKRE